MRKLTRPVDLTSRAYEEIKRFMLEGRLDENTKLSETWLSAQLGISRSPVREALNSLQTEGLIHIEARQGAYLKRFSVEEINDLYDLRRLLEVYAIRNVKITPELIGGLEKSVERSSAFLKRNKKYEFIEEDMCFHGSIAAATGKRPLHWILDHLQHQIWLCRCKTYNLSSSHAPREHRMIVEALQKQDRRLAQKLMHSHISYVKSRLLDFVAQRQLSHLPLSGDGVSPGVEQEKSRRDGG